MLTHLEFRSDLFPPYEGEEALINPGMYGKRLAEFLKAGLQREGFELRDIFTEDWGWVVPITNPEFALWIGCANLDEEPDGFLCFIEPHQPFVRKFLRKIEARSRVESLQRAIDRIVSAEPRIREKRWWTYNDFMNRPSQPDPIEPLA